MFDPDKFYQTDDPALLVLGPYSTLAHWRSEGRGPAYVKFGRRVLYRGSVLNAWIESKTIVPNPANAGARAASAAA